METILKEVVQRVRAWADARKSIMGENADRISVVYSPDDEALELMADDVRALVDAVEKLTRLDAYTQADAASVQIHLATSNPITMQPDLGDLRFTVFRNEGQEPDWQAYAQAEAAGESFQQRVQPWMMACFGEMIAGDREERNHRFLEESLELVQACGCTKGEAYQLVEYVYGRPDGEKHQEVGGVMVTLAALCLAQGLDMHDCAETELARIWTKVEQIRAKQAAKPKHSPLPVAPAKPSLSKFATAEEYFAAMSQGEAAKATPSAKSYTSAELVSDAMKAAGVGLDAKPWNVTPAMLHAPRQPPRLLTDAQVREIFLAHGFAIKEGQADLKPYVFDAAHALMEATLGMNVRSHEALPTDMIVVRSGAHTWAFNITTGECAKVQP